MMRYKKSIITMVWLGLLSFAATSCAVDEEPSMLLTGSLVLEGTLDDTTGRVDFTFPTNITDASLFYSQGSYSITQARQNGQDGAANVCLSGQLGTFTFVAGFENRLPDSRTVGAPAGGGNYPNMSLDANWINIQGAEVNMYGNFPVNGSTARFSMKRERTFSTILESNGGTAVLGVPIIANMAELQELEDFVLALGESDDSFTFFAEIKIIGETFAGTAVESNIFKYPVEICADCGVGVTPTCVY